MKTTIYQPLFALFVLLLATLACVRATPTPPPAVATPIEVPVGAATPEPGLPPTAAPTPIPTTAGRMVTFENVRFSVPTGLAQSEFGEIVPPATDGTPWDVTVQHIKFNFSGYPQAGALHQPVIVVYPTTGFDPAADTIANLKDLLAARPADANPMPFLPLSNAAQMFRAQVKYLDFENGSGVRYLTQFGQGIWPVNNRDMFYTFQGLTADGQYYISAILPVAHSALPASGEGADLAKLGEDYPGYIAGIRSQLDAQPESSFTPSLATLDALVQSIRIK